MLKSAFVATPRRAGSWRASTRPLAHAEAYSAVSDAQPMPNRPSSSLSMAVGTHCTNPSVRLTNRPKILSSLSRNCGVHGVMDMWKARAGRTLVSRTLSFCVGVKKLAFKHFSFSTKSPVMTVLAWLQSNRAVMCTPSSLKGLDGGTYVTFRPCSSTTLFRGAEGSPAAWLAASCCAALWACTSMFLAVVHNAFFPAALACSAAVTTLLSALDSMWYLFPYTVTLAACACRALIEPVQAVTSSKKARAAKAGWSPPRHPNL